MSKRRKEGKRVGSYSYTKFNELKVGDQRANVMGLIEVCDPPAPSKSDVEVYTCYFELADESDTKVTCKMSDSDPDYLPHYPCYGDIICFRKVAVDNVEGKLVIKTSSNTVWMLLRKKENYSKPSSYFTTASLTITEKCRLAHLKTWAAKRDPTNTPPIKRAEQDITPSSSANSTSTSSFHTISSSAASSQPAPPHPPHPAPPHLAAPPSIVPSHITGVPRVSRPTKSRFYDTPLTPIAQQVVGSKEGAVIGVLKYFKPPTPSKGQDHFTVLSLVDESQHATPLSCVIFNPQKSRLPVAGRPGEIVLVKGLVIGSFQGSVQARGHENSLVGIFPSDPSSPPPQKIGDWYVLKDAERSRVQQLRAWAARESPFLLNSKLEDLTCDNFCVTLCQVLCVGMGRTGNMQLAVCDGTQTKVSPASAFEAPPTVLSQVPTLLQGYRGLLATVHLPGGFKHQVIAGDVVQLINLRMSRCERLPPTRDPAGLPTEVMELVIGEDPYHGNIDILPGDSPAVARFKATLPEIKAVAPPPPSPPPAPVHSSRPLQLSTVICCEDSKHASLTEIREAPVGSVHVAEVQVLGLGSSVCKCLEDICQLRCVGCKTRYLTPRPQDPDHHDLMTSGDVCVCCSPDELHEPNTLRFMYGFTLVITDRHTQMEVAVSGVEGEKFFSQMQASPANLYVDRGAWQRHRDLLRRMTGGADPLEARSLDSAPHRPSLNLCILVFLSVTNKRGYKIVNTNLCNL